MRIAVGEGAMRTRTSMNYPTCVGLYCPLIKDRIQVMSDRLNSNINYIVGFVGDPVSYVGMKFPVPASPLELIATLSNPISGRLPHC